MKNNIQILIIVCFVLILSGIKAQDCSSTVKINSTDICLPQIKGFKEVSKDSKYRDLVKANTYGRNVILGAYIDKTVSHFISATVFINDALKKDIDNKMFTVISTQMGIYFKKDYNLKQLMKKYSVKKNFKIDRDVLIESYSLNSSIRTYLLLGKVIWGNREVVILKTLNMLHLKNKIVLSNYMIEYDNSNSINKIKQKNDYFVMRLWNENN